MNFVSAVDMFKIGVGPSSSHTLGPWRAALAFIESLERLKPAQSFRVSVTLYGSLAQTGKGHGTDVAIICGAMGLDYTCCDTVDLIKRALNNYQTQSNFVAPIKHLSILYCPDERLDYHANGMLFSAYDDSRDETPFETTFFSIGGGFIVKTGDETVHESQTLPHPIIDAVDLISIETSHKLDVLTIIYNNECAIRKPIDVKLHLYKIWKTMCDSMYQGCQQTGYLMGGLNVRRRANGMYSKLITETIHLNGFKAAADTASWLQMMHAVETPSFSDTLKWVSVFALAVNEQNAAFNRVVTAPTNGSAGVIPAVLMYALHFYRPSVINADCNAKRLDREQLCQSLGISKSDAFLLIASTIGGLFKQKATISAAMGGCQAEIGVSSAMAAAGLSYLMGASTPQILVAAEIAMEHHLGLTCDPVGGLVQIPCIERNAIGAVKAITAAHLALEADPAHCKVSLDAVISTMWQTAQDMNSQYKETAQAGLAVHIPVSLSEC